MDKLVRNRIPEIIQKNTGVYPNIRILNDEEFHEELVNKLYEEILEYEDSGNIEELADIYEVLMTLARIHPAAGSFQSKIIDKNFHRGAFKRRYYLIDEEV